MTYSEALVEITGAMQAAHAASCPVREDGHRWERCTWTPSVYAVGDALDVLDSGRDDVSVVARALHDRMCRDGDCGVAEADGHARLSFYVKMAEALVARHQRE